MISPDFAEFCRLGATRRVVSVYTKVVADDTTPVGLYHRLCGQRANTFLLESAEVGQWGRYSFIGVTAAGVLTERDGTTVWDGADIAGLPTAGDPLTALTQVLELLHTELDPALPPFTSGLVGYLGYDLVRRLEHLPDGNVNDLALPELALLLVTDLAVFDHQTQELWLIANAINFDAADTRIEAAYADAVARVQAMLSLLAQPVTPLTVTEVPSEAVPVRRQRRVADYGQAVSSAIDQIYAGEAFQVVVSQRFEVDCQADALDVYRVLRRTNPSPYLYLFRFADFAVVGSSPEALVTVSGGEAVTHPIAGTRPRGASVVQDAALEAELLADEKERAEHIMLVDLGRNDLGRVCEPGSVRVLEFLKVRRYSHVMHLEAAVAGRVAAGHTALDVTMACFPAGTLTGAPKVRAMEIIDELEVSRRGLYGGVVGYFDLAGNADTAIAIRTAVLRDSVAYVQAGAGVVADSVPELENRECENKAKAVISAVQTANSWQRLPVGVSAVAPTAGGPGAASLAAGVSGIEPLAAERITATSSEVTP